MTRARDSHIYRSLASVIPPRRVRRLARQMRVVQRRRKVDPVALVNALVLGFDGGERRTIAGLRRAYERTTGTTLAPSAFYDRLTPELAGLLQQLSHEAFADLGRRVPSMALALQAFQQVFAADGSLVRLHDTLQQHYPSVWTNHTKASAKVHVLMDAASRLPLTVQVVPGSRHDLNILQIGPWVRDRLLIFDLAYYQGEKFRSIQEHGGFFLCRVKKDANFVVLGSPHPDQVGKRLQQVLREERGRTFDVEVDYAYRRILQRDYQWRRLRLRIVGVWNEQARRHRLYITNASAVQLAAQHLGAVYALRWEIELLFRELKSVGGDEPSAVTPGGWGFAGFASPLSHRPLGDAVSPGQPGLAGTRYGVATSPASPFTTSPRTAQTRGP